MRIFVFIILIFTSCSSSKLRCSKFYTYSAKKIDVKGITSKLKKQGVEVADVSVAEISIDPKYVIASEKLQELDLFQYSLCAQIKGLPKRDSLRRVTTINYINTLMRMLQVAQNPDSLLYNKISNLETAEAIRSSKEKQFVNLKSTPPKVDAILQIKDNRLGFSIVLLNDVPVACDFYVTEYGSSNVVSSILLQKAVLYPTGSKVFHINYSDITNWGLTTPTKVTLHFSYESIYFPESLDPNLKSKFVKSYMIDPQKKQIQQIEAETIK